MRYFISWLLADDLAYKDIQVCDVLLFVASLPMFLRTHFQALDACLCINVLQGDVIFSCLYLFSIFFRLEILCYSLPHR